MRDGILAERQSFYLDNQAERELAEVAEEFIGQYYSASPAMPRTIVVGPYLRDRAELLAAALGERRGSPVEVRVAERGDKRRLRELAERNARLPSTGPAAREHHGTEAGRSLGDCARTADEELPVRIGARHPNLGGEHTVPRWSSLRGRDEKADYRRSGARRAQPRVRRFASRRV